MLHDEPTDNTMVENGDESGMEREVAHDARCHRCGYNLRGLKPSGRCPECGAPVRVSLAGEALQFADPVWVSRIDAGANWSCFAFWIGMALTWVAIMIGWLFDELMHVLMLSATGVTLLTLFIGCWLLASPNPSTARDERWYSIRRIIRNSIVIGVFSSTLGIVLYVVDPGSTLWRWMALLSAPFGLSGAIGAYAFCRYCAWIARKVGDEFSEKQSRLYLRGFIASWLFFGPGLVLLLLLSSNSNSMLCLLIPGLIGAFAFGILILFLPTYFAERIEQNLKLAREIWNEAEDESDASP